ncbi:multicopper oxidase [Streptomyces sp. SID2888]|uniref:multicopper oxidase family protein n=1 Tax=Streptomyces sp. SID2888 TaxID=2690256 RepID=UPI001367EBEC|nr:multicopper oxidase [Streptomyces sp. SID2888]MYV45410.1 multicopper oxidase domain-containing protein [Streptomyces sp. SID2888]
MVSRRRVLQAGVAGGTSFLLAPGKAAARPASVEADTLDPSAVEKYVAELVIPPVMPPDSRTGGEDRYTIGVRQFRQQILPPGRPATTVWGYGATGAPETFHFPACTIEARHGRTVRVRWVNQLVDPNGGYRPHLLPVDPTLHWANPGGGVSGRDSHPDFDSTPGPYRGPVPIVTHLHGGENEEESDGYAEAWYLPDARDIPRGYARQGSFYDVYAEKSRALHGVPWGPADAVFHYANRGRASTLWFHDHVLGITRLNVYAGLAGFYLLRGGPVDLEEGVLPGPAPRLGDPPGTRHHEIPVVVQDRSFRTDGSLFYPPSRALFDQFEGPYIPGSDIAPIWNPEYFGTTMVTNGRTWPVLTVEPRRYRFRFLNGCNARTLILKIVRNPLAHRPAPAALDLWQLGSDGGFLPAPVQRDDLLLAPAERADVVVDFTSLPVGTELYLINEGPDVPYPGGVAGKDFTPADARTTGQVMKFTVGPLTAPDTSTAPARLTLPPLEPLGAAGLTRRLSLNELSSDRLPGVGPRVVLLGTFDAQDRPKPLRWDDPITETPVLGATEIWEIHNLTNDAHPIHVHELQFQVVDRQPLPAGSRRPPEAGERGFKDTVIAPPHAITRIKLRFGRAGRFMWHCHMLEHEDNEMMRPFLVGPA